MGFEAVPLRNRLPNPPAEFLGRDADVDWLRRTLQNAPVAIVAGPDGVGKTALACTVARSLEPGFRGAVLAEARGSRPLLAAARALAACSGVELDWAPLLTNSEQLTATAIDLAEAGPWVVVLDGLTEGPQTTVCLELLFRYARQARWLATVTRLPELPDYLEQCRVLARLDRAGSEQLAQRLSPTLAIAERDTLLSQTDGLPGAIRAALARPRPSKQPPQVSKEAQRLYAALEIAECAVPAAHLMKGAAPGVQELVAAAVAFRSDDDFISVVPAKFDCEPDMASLTLVAGALLETMGTADQRLGALRALTAAKDPPNLTRGIDRLGPALIAQGYASELLQLIRSHSPLPRGLVRYRLACLAELGSEQSVGLIGLPEDASPEERLEWAKVETVRGEFENARLVATQVADDATASAVGRFEATLLLVRLAALAGSTQDQLNWLERAQPGDPDEQAQVDVRIAQCRVAAGNVAEARRLVETLIPKLDVLAPRTARDVRYGIAHVLYVAGELRRAREVLSPDDVSAHGAGVAMHPERRLLTFRAVLSLDTGQLDACRGLLDRLRPYAPPGSAHAPFVELILAQVDLARGELGRAQQRIEELTQLARAKKSGLLLGSLLCLQEKLALLAGPGHSAADPLPSDPPLVAPFDDLHRVQRALRLRRLGEDPPTFTPRASPVVEVELRSTLLRATTEMLTGGVESALASSRALAKRAGDLGFFWLEVEANKLACETLLVLADGTELSRAVRVLSNAAEASSCQALADEAALVGLGCRPPAPSEVERLASNSVSAETRRRARALLGEAVELDAVDSAVVEALLRHGVEIETLTPGRRSEGWGIDERTMSVWTADGISRDLSRRPQLWRLLTHVVAHGSATKESLVSVLWPDEPYHPLKHDNRLQAQVRQLRRSIEADPAAPERLLTTGEGYAVGEEQALRRRPAPQH